VQATLCDALASRHAPTDAEEVPRWVMGIARNKLADHFRIASRDARLVPGALSLTEPVLERALLRQIADYAKESPSGMQTLGWIVREASGDQLAEIAEEEQVPAAVVRQRVSRWRKRARAVFLLAAASLALALIGRAVLTSVNPEVPLSNVAAHPRAAGRWRILVADIPEGADPRLRKLAGVSIETADLVVQNGRARFESLGLQIDRAYELVPAPADAAELRGTMTTVDGALVPIEVRFDGGRAILTGGGARFVLAR
jgi:hypothetical protein